MVLPLSFSRPASAAGAPDALVLGGADPDVIGAALVSALAGAVALAAVDALLLEAVLVVAGAELLEAGEGAVSPVPPHANSTATQPSKRGFMRRWCRPL